MQVIGRHQRAILDIPLLAASICSLFWAYVSRRLWSHSALDVAVACLFLGVAIANVALVVLRLRGNRSKRVLLAVAALNCVCALVFGAIVIMFGNYVRGEALSR
jgi:predicted membrane-bound dolichyl-phosphate-mannose-protein mannosyltransferase